MKLPIWAKDKAGNYKVFPYELLKPLDNGMMGVYWPYYYSDWRQSDMLWEFKEHFELRCMSVPHAPDAVPGKVTGDRTVYILKSTIPLKG